MHRIAQTTIDADAVRARTVRRSDGGVVVFEGIVREGADDGRSVDGLFYEADERGAVAIFEQIARECIERFGDVRIAIEHRIGELKVGECAVFVCAAATHRAAAFKACAYAIDELKSRAPIWKKEHYNDGSAAWIDNAC